MAPTLNTEDINLLKDVFATKEDLVSMEKRQDQKYAIKADLIAMEQRQDKKYATKNDLKSLASKEDLKKGLTNVTRTIMKKLNFFFNTLDRHMMHLDRRLTKVEHHLQLTPVE